MNSVRTPLLEIAYQDIKWVGLPAHQSRRPTGRRPQAVGLPYRSRDRTYRLMWARSFSFSGQKYSKISLSGNSNCVTLKVNGLVYILGSSMVI